MLITTCINQQQGAIKVRVETRVVIDARKDVMPNTQVGRHPFGRKREAHTHRITLSVCR